MLFNVYYITNLYYLSMLLIRIHFYQVRQPQVLRTDTDRFPARSGRNTGGVDPGLAVGRVY